MTVLARRIVVGVDGSPSDWATERAIRGTSLLLPGLIAAATALRA